jgi:XTP/dITP diphosphohydrolase
MRALILATGNAGKLREIRDLLAGTDIEILPQDDHGVPEVAEDGLSFIENALIKARNASRHAGLPALADDSGLVVDALAGAPGIRSARYAGEPSDDRANNDKLLAALADIPEDQRTARFVCAMAMVRHADDPTPVVCVGEWHGRIATDAQGSNGFGYDPLFVVPERGCRSAELSHTEKGQLSHRGHALRLLLERIRDGG